MSKLLNKQLINKEYIFCHTDEVVFFIKINLDIQYIKHIDDRCGHVNNYTKNQNIQLKYKCYYITYKYETFLVCDLIDFDETDFIGNLIEFKKLFNKVKGNSDIWLDWYNNNCPFNIDYNTDTYWDGYNDMITEYYSVKVSKITFCT
jgi:hypothetical protein